MPDFKLKIGGKGIQLVRPVQVDIGRGAPFLVFDVFVLHELILCLSGQTTRSLKKSINAIELSVAWLQAMACFAWGMTIISEFGNKL